MRLRLSISDPRSHRSSTHLGYHGYGAVLCANCCKVIQVSLRMLSALGLRMMLEIVYKPKDITAMISMAG